MRAVGEIMALAAAMHRPVIVRFRHVGEHLRVNVVREHAVEHEVRERGIGRSRGVDRGDDEIAQALDRKAAISRL